MLVKNKTNRLFGKQNSWTFESLQQWKNESIEIVSEVT